MTQNRVKIIGITGGIASGKSTVSKMIIDEGYPLIDSDQVAREVVSKGSAGLEKVVGAFGGDILDDEGNLDRALLGDIVFGNDEKRRLLDKILHPFITESILHKIKGIYSNEPVVFVDMPLLFEVNERINKEGLVFDQVWLVYVDSEDQLERLVKRNNISRDAALKRIRSQMDIEKKKYLADEVIENSGSVDETRKQLLRLLDRLGSGEI